MDALSGRQYVIESGDQRATVVEMGAGLRTYSGAGRDILDGYHEHEMSTSGRGQVLIPWPNRLEDGVYDFDGRHQLPINEPATLTAIHGLVRWLPWEASEHSDERVVMETTLLPQPGYPFALGLTVEYIVGPGGLRVRTTATNIGSRRCPFGGGAHPYLRLGDGPVDSVTLTLPASSYLRTDDRGLPISREAVDGTEYDFRSPRPIGATSLDHAFFALERDAHGRTNVRLSSPDGKVGVTLWVDESYPWLMVFTGDSLPDVSRRSLAVEPMTCPPNAYRTGAGLIVLEPGESFTGEWGISSDA